MLLAMVAAGCGGERGVLAPSLAAIRPSRAVAGKTLTIALTGANFTRGASIKIGAAPIGVSQTTVVSPTHIEATFAVAADAAPGITSIRVSSGGQMTNVVAFTIAAPLGVTSTNPGSGAGGVAVNSAVTVISDEAVNCDTVSGGNFSLTAPGGAAIAGTIACAGSTASFSPTQRLTSSTAYTATLSTAITDPAGDGLAANYAWSFTTAVPPTVTSTNPGGAATGVPINQSPLLVGFSQPLNCATVTGASFLVATVAGVPVSGAVTCSNSTAYFVPAAALALNTLYTATITAAVSNAAGAPLVGAYQWNFKTARAPPVPSGGGPDQPRRQVARPLFAWVAPVATPSR
ncbi:MAG TPA: Ig-like domain-containing protein [Terriglobales bacterium]|nr:Ig-like domain-containing protein [Terriglobales bacterium]